MSIFKAYDVRGKYPQEWNSEMAYKIGRCLPELLEADSVLIGRDARASSPEIFEALSRGVIEAGADVVDMGLSTTPMVYFATASGGYPASVMITASHNPPIYNGLKVSKTGAVPVGYESGLNMLEKMVQKPPSPASRTGRMKSENFLQPYAEHLLSFAGGMKPVRVAVDYGNGMVGLLHEQVFNKLPVSITPLNSEVDGSFPNHEPNPTIKENLLQLSELVTSEKMDFGIAFDGDGDRVVFLDEKGHLISPDLMIAVLAAELLPTVEDGQTVLYDVRSSRSVPEAVESLGGKPVMWRVGHAYMKQKLRDDNAFFGGELAGHYYYRDNFFCDSGALSAIIGLRYFSRQDKSVSECLLSLNSRSFSGELNFSVEQKEVIIQKLKKLYTDGTLTELDGIRVDMENWWFNVRPSNTESLLRLVVEANDPYELAARVDELSAIITGDADKPVNRSDWFEQGASLQLIADTLRVMSAEGVQRASSGHPGMPLGMADVAALLWTKYLKLDPRDPDWPDRDRFVLSAGHGSMLLYSLLHLAGFDLSKQELDNFRQWGSITPGHPERGETPGVEITTGPLGQGISAAVGMALAERMLAARFNHVSSDNPKLVDHRTWVIAGDGDMMEGVTAEAISLAGHLKLGKLKVIYDDNRISIDGSTDLSFSEDVCRRFEACGWRTIKADGHDLADLERALDEACIYDNAGDNGVASDSAPVLIAVRTIIGKGSPNKCDTSSVHGSPLGWDEIRLIREKLGWPDRAGAIPPSVRRSFASRAEEWKTKRQEWDNILSDIQGKQPETAREFFAMMSGILPDNIDELMPVFEPGTDIATRKASGEVLNRIYSSIPGLTGGSADLTPSNNTKPLNSRDIMPGDYSGTYIRFGIREHAMAAVLNGLAAHGGFRPYGATFLVFADYLRPAIRMAAMMKLPVIYVLTHDSFMLGEDGPTHQPESHLPSLRAMPNVYVIRPADANETVQAWHKALEIDDAPVVIALTRQNVPVLEQIIAEDDSESGKAVADMRHQRGLATGAYIISDDDAPEMVLIASGSEVHIALQAAELLRGEGRRIRVVSMPGWELFMKQSRHYQNSVIPVDANVKKVAIEAASPFGWERWTGQDGLIIGLDRFGASAPAGILAEKFGFTPQGIADRIKRRWPDM